MECNKEEAIRAMDIAKRKVTENDYNGAKKYAEKAQNLYPELDGMKQVLMMINVYITAENKICGGESDWYGILGVDPFADEGIVKKQYKRLALLLHPDKNKCKGAEDAFKLVSEAWCLLSDKVKRIAYDQKRKSKEVKQRKTRKPKQPPNQQNQQAKKQKQPPNQKKQPPNQQKQPPNQPKQPAPIQKKQPPNQPKQAPNQPKQPAPNQKKQPPNQPKQPPNQQQQPPNQQQQAPNPPKQPPNQQKQDQPKQSPSQQKQAPNQEQKSPNKQKQPPNQPSSSVSRNGRGKSNKPTPKVSTFWTMCNSCCTPYEYVRVYYLNKTVRCRNCLGNFVASENQKTSTEKENTSTENQKTPQETNKNTNGVSSCGRDSSQSVSDGNSFQRDCSTSRMVNPNIRNATNQAEESIKRGAEGSQDGIANSDFKLEERVFKKLKTNDYAETNGGIKV